MKPIPEVTKILVIEDDLSMQTVLVTLLESEGYEVKATTRGDEAIVLAQDSDFDLIVADIRTEGGSGLDAIEEVKRHSPKVQSLVVTGYSSEEESIRAIRLGVKEYFKKPFRLDEFLKSVRLLIAKAREEKDRILRREELETGLLWAVRFANDCLNRVPELKLNSRLSEIEPLAQSLGNSLGLSSESVRAVQITSLIKVIEPHCGSEPSLSAYLQIVLRHIDEYWDGSGGPDGLEKTEIPLESRLAALITTVLDPSCHSAESLELQFPGRFDPALIKAYELRAESDSKQGSLSSDKRRGLLRLGRVLEDTGNLVSSRSAYLELRASSGDSREKVEALRGLARLDCMESRFSEAVVSIEEAAIASEQVGPASAANCYLELGLLLHQIDQGDAVSYLKKAGRLFKHGGVAVGQAKAFWAMAAVGQSVEQAILESSLELLNRAENISELVSTAGWLFNAILEREQSSSLWEKRTISKFCQEAPRSVKGLLREEQLSAKARFRLVQELGEGSNYGLKEILELLSKDADSSVTKIARQKIAETGESTTPPVLRIFSMGPLEVHRGDILVPEAEWRTQKIRYLVAQLAYRRGRPLAEEVIIETLWPDKLLKGKNSLYWATSVARKLLRPEGWDSLDYLPRNSGRMQFNPDLPRWHDVEELEELVAAVKKFPDTERPKNLGLYQKIQELYRGPFLENCYLEWAQAVRSKLEDDSCRALIRLSEWAWEDGLFSDSLEYASSALELDPYSQAGHLQVMKSAVSLSRPEVALAQYDKAERLLRRDLDIEPSTILIEWKHRALLI